MQRRALCLALTGAGALGAAAADLVPRVAAARRSVCAVGTYSALDNPRFTYRGTGFAVGDGTLVATCHHVLPPTDASGQRRLIVQLPGNDGLAEHRDAAVVASDRQHDLALLRIAPPALPALGVAEAGAAREGLEVFFIGFPIGGVLGFAPVTHRGIVSSLVASIAPPPAARGLSAAAVRQARDGAFVLIQLDAVAYPGNSGGPLIDATTGLVVGVVNMVLLKGTRESALSAPSGISYAVPSRYLLPLVRENSR